MKEAIVLCSGGLDSVTTAFYVKEILKYEEVTLVFFNYNQRNLLPERKASKACCRKLKAKFIEIKLPELGKNSTSLLNSTKKHKKISRSDLKDTLTEGNKWYVPCRNAAFLINSLALAERLFIKKRIASDIFVGFKSEGDESYPDATPEFVKSVNQLSRASCTYPFKIKAPMIRMDKEDIITMAKKLGVNLKETFSCYTSSKKHCGSCLACMLRKEGFYWANIEDPTVYSSG